MKKTLLLFTASFFFFACKTESKHVSEDQIASDITEKRSELYSSFVKSISDEEKDTLLTDLASFIIRKPASATWETKFNPEFREYFRKNRNELDVVYLTEVSDTFYFYLLRETRTPDGMKFRGTGGKYIFNKESKSIEEFEEVFVSKVLPESELEKIGIEYMNLGTKHSNLSEFLSRDEQIEWPDGRLFYSKLKKEWRYVE